MFTTPCIIRKNTPELRDKLGKMGYRVCRRTEETTAVYLMAGHGDIHAVAQGDDRGNCRVVHERE